MFFCRPGLARDIFILVGQSNMEGRGSVSDLPSFPNAARVFAYTSNAQWISPANEPLPGSNSLAIPQVESVAPAKAGPGLAFGDRLAELRPYVEIGLVQCAKGGYGIEYWAKDYRVTTLYGSCIKRAVEAAQSGTVRGILIFNGESDANPERISYYPTRMARLIQDLRDDLGSKLPVIVTKIGPEPHGNTHFTSWRDMQLRQAELGVPNGAVVTAADLQSDGPKSPHLTTASYVILGRRYAEAMHSLLGP
jgi:Carbohydrate esterase, sialic acid-specific acetylesterase